MRNRRRVLGSALVVALAVSTGGSSISSLTSTSTSRGAATASPGTETPTRSAEAAGTPSTLFGSPLPGLGAALRAATPPEEAATGKVWPAEKRARELPDRRTANGRVYQLTDGRTQAEIAAGPVNYRDTSGRYQPIDTRVTKSNRPGFAAANTTNTFTSLFGTSTKHLVRFEQGARHIELALDGAARTVTPQVTGSTVTYRGLAGGGADLVYTVTPSTLKEEIVLRAAPTGEVSYSFTVQTAGLTARQGPGGTVEFVRPSGGEPAYVMPAAVMYDSRDDGRSPYGKAWSDRVTQKLERHGATTTVTVTPDRGWLTGTARKYPVVIDPTIKIQPVPVNGQDVQIYSGATTTNFNDTYQLKVGTDSTQAYRTLVRFPLTGVPTGTTLDAARLEMYYSQTHTTFDYDVAMEARQVTQPWSESTATWANASANIAPTPAGNSVQVDDGDPGTSVVGTWPFSTNPDVTPLAVNGDYRFNNDATTGQTHTWVPTITESGDYQVEVHFTSESDRPTNAPYTVFFDGGQKTYQVDQNGGLDGRWQTLGVHPFAAGTTGRVVLGDVANKSVIADAVRFTRFGVATKKRAISSVWSSFPVRNVVQGWVNGTQANNGFMVKAVDESPKGRGGPIFEASEFAYQNGGRDFNLPRLILTWGRPGVTLAPPTTVTSTGAALSWSAYQDPSGAAGDNLVEYQVHRSVRQTFVPSAATLVAPLSPGTLSYQDTTATPTPADTPDSALGNYYYYMIAVKTADGQVIAAPTEGVRLPKAGRVTRIFRTGTVDTTLSKALPDTNVDVYDGDPYVSPGNNSTFYGDTRGVVKFPTLTGIPAGAQVTDAQLRMWATQVIPGPDEGVIDVHRLTRGFNETAATWNKADATTTWTTPGGDFDPTPMSAVDGLTNDPEWQEWDVEPAVRGWLTTPSSNFGFLLRMHDEVAATMRVMLLASEGAEPMLRPTLQVTYLEPTPASTYHAPLTPARMLPGDTQTVTVTVSNPTLTAWNSADWELSYRWALPDGTDVTNGGNQVATPLPKTIVPGDTVDITATMKSPIQSDSGNKRTDYVLKWELHNRTTGQWLSTVAGIASLDQNVAVEDPTSDQLGLESFYQYTGNGTGAGGTLMNNLFAGNTVWSYDAFTNPSRGLATFLRLAYNSQDTSDTVAGFGWSIQTSAPMRLGAPLDFHPNPNPTTVRMTDGDGTSHVFSWDAAAGQWRSPKGVHLFLQQLVACDSKTEESKAWLMTRPDRTQFFFDCDGYVSSVEDNNGNVMTFTYEVRRSQNKPTKFLRYLTDPVSRQTLTVDYYAKGDSYDFVDDTTWTKQQATNLTNPHIIDHVKQIRDISGRTVTFTYTDKGLLGEVVDGAGSAQPKVFAFRYDMTQGNKNVKLVRVTDPRGHATALDYYSRPEDDPKFKWNTKSYTDRLGKVTSFAYTDPDGTAGSQIQTVVTDAENHANTSVMDGFGRPVRMTNAKSQTTNLGWDADNNVIRLEEANGAVSTWAYDPLTGYPTEIKDAEANANGWPGTTLTYQTQLDGHIADVATKQSQAGRKWTFTYTVEGDLATVTDPLGSGTAAVGDFTTSYTYDAWGQLLTATDANGNTTTNSDFEDSGYPRTITDALDNATTFTYDVRGQVTKVVDPRGKDTSQTYDVFGRPLQSSVPKDLSATPPVYITTPAPVYDANDNVTVSTAANGAVTTKVYDAADQLTSSLAPVDNPGDPQRQTSYTYDDVGNLLTTTEPKGNLTATVGDFTTTYTYDEIYQTSSILDADNQKTSYTYDDVGNVLTIVDPRKNATADTTDFTTKYAYDRNHRDTKVTDALGKFTTTTYDRDGLVTATTDELGNTTQATVDARGMTTEVKVPQKTVDGATVFHVTRYEYDQVGNRTRVISPRGVATTDDPDDFATTTAYDELNRVKETLTAFDRDDARYRTPDRTTYTYDPAGRLTTMSAPPSAGETVRNDTTYTYFDNGLTKSSTDPWDIVTTYDYDARGDQTSRTVTSAGGSSNRTMTWQYYPDGKLKSRADEGVPVGSAVVLADNSDFNNTSATGTWPASTTGPGLYGHNFQSHPAGTGTNVFTWGLNVPRDGSYEVFVRYPTVSGAATDAKYTVSHSGGDTVKTVNQSTGGGTWVSLGFFTFADGNSQKITLSDAAGGTVLADAVKLVRDNTGETDAEKHDYSYRYDPNANLTTITDASPGARTDAYAVTYTGLNQVASVQESKSGQVQNTTSFTYNENGALLTTSHDRQHSSYEYDPRDLLAKVTNGTSATDPDPMVTTYTYTDRGERLRQVKGNGNTVDYTYLADGALHTQTEKKPGGALVADHVLDYDLDGNRTRDASQTMNADDHAALLSTTADYTYDPRNRIATVTRTGAGASTESYVHDANDNVISQTVKGIASTFNYDRNRLLTATAAGVTASYNYDPFGRLDTVSAVGTVLSRNVYDGFDHLVENRQNNGTTTTTTKYTYDPLDRTSSRTNNAGAAGEETTTFDYLGLAGDVLDEMVDGQVRKSYQYAPSGQLLSQTTFNEDGTQEDAFFGYGPHSDVEQLTDASGDTKATYGYTAYGSNNDALFTGADKPDTQNPAKPAYSSYRFNAKRWDPASRSYDMGFRDYDPGLNRFLTRDSYNGALSDMRLGLNPYTGNRYAFGGGNPISTIELDGHCGWNPTSWLDCASDAGGAIVDGADAAWDWTTDTATAAWDWTVNAADTAWDWAWDVGSDVVNWVGDTVSDIGDWVAHNADALADMALDALEIVGGALAAVGGVALIATGVTACAASTPLVLTGVGAVATGGICWGGLATAGGGLALTGLGVAMMADGGSGLGEDAGRLESANEGSGSSTPEPNNPKRRDDNWLKRNGVDPHEVKDELPGRGGYQDIYVDRNGNIYAVRKGTNPNDGEYIGNMRDFQD